MRDRSIGVAILGGTGFGAGELLRLLTVHPEAAIVSVVSSSSAGKPISSAHPHLRGIYDTSFTAEIDIDACRSSAKTVVISALPHGESGVRIAEIRKELPSAVIIDLSGDLRLTSEASHTLHYPKSPFLPEIRSRTVYGLTELFREQLPEALTISNPGCLATAAILAVAPFSRFCAATPIVLNLATGSSGAGKEPKVTTHHPVRHANFYSYKPLSHQHLPEIDAALRTTGLAETPLAFVPHSLPVSRGILCTAYLTLREELPLEILLGEARSFYEKSPFVRVLGEGVAELENVVGSNFCDLSIACDAKTVVVNAAIDNLVKGMAGQAIQNMNVALGLPETTGLWFPSLRPI